MNKIVGTSILVLLICSLVAFQLSVECKKQNRKLRAQMLMCLQALKVRKAVCRATKVKFVTTAYVEEDGFPWADGKGATLLPVGRGMIAADWKIFPPGTILYIPRYGYGVVLDKGSAIKGKRLDLFMPSLKEAKEWGRREVEVQVVDKRGVIK